MAVLNLHIFFSGFTVGWVSSFPTLTWKAFFIFRFRSNIHLVCSVRGYSRPALLIVLIFSFFLFNFCTSQLQKQRNNESHHVYVSAVTKDWQPPFFFFLYALDRNNETRPSMRLAWVATIYQIIEGSEGTAVACKLHYFVILERINHWRRDVVSPRCSCGTVFCRTTITGLCIVAMGKIYYR